MQDEKIQTFWMAKIILNKINLQPQVTTANTDLGFLPNQKKK